ncbi:chain-length determining protein [Brevundimonas sp. MYb46]|nr:chain-length determining protein [Brevundimonas sp. MYb31]PRA21254.1 chain-length determining protein [Brevundimonas sp. MYb27]PRB10228.1 chain-length determining protein [Brevundimonas sp. MYb52]PRB32218.1 chain-length determining protein [Brevundimonas sp. MYb46]PRB44178.1 chain-length determining protein [Brevundimonas sp. MYb33]
MADTKLQYLGALPKLLPARSGGKHRRKAPVGFLIVVALPTLLACLYYLVIASPRYVSEARFVVRSANVAQPSTVGMALHVAGFSTGINDAFAVHEYLTSRDSLQQLDKQFDLRAVLGRKGADALARYPRPWEGQSEEALYKAFQRFLTVGYDSTTGISTIRVEAFRPQDARALNLALLDSGEKLINQLNDRAAANAVSDAERDQKVAVAAAENARQALTNFRNSARFIDPRTEAAESTQITATLLVTIAQLKAERDQLAAEAPASPQLAPLDRRIGALERQVSEARARMAGGADSLAPKVGTYEDLILQREIAERRVTQAEASLLSAQQDAARQKLYLERIVAPSLPDKGTAPNRWKAILTIFASSMLLYAIGWLVWAGIREHRQD